MQRYDKDEMPSRTPSVDFREAVESLTRAVLRIPFRLNVRYHHIVSPTAPTYVFIHGLADTGEIWKPILGNLPHGCNYIVVDLLGHGKSPRSSAKVYSSEYQARNVIATCLALGCIGPYVFVGHSFGSIVSVECARRYPRTARLILCALPLYQKRTGDPMQPEAILFSLYEKALAQPKSVITAYGITRRFGLIGSSRTSVNEHTFLAFSETVRAGVINQKTWRHLAHLSLPIVIIYGKLDPVVISKNIDLIAKHRPNITVVPLVNDHAMRAPMIRALLEHITTN